MLNIVYIYIYIEDIHINILNLLEEVYSAGLIIFTTNYSIVCVLKNNTIFSNLVFIFIFSRCYDAPKTKLSDFYITIFD